MRVVIADSDVRAGRNLADSIDRLHPQADVLLYADAPDAVAGVTEHKPDVVFVAPQVGNVDGPEAAGMLAAAAAGSATVVGIVASPDAGRSQQYVTAGATVVVARPVDDLAIRVALRQRADGIPR